MKHYKIPFFDEFECIGSSCPYTCCGVWGILVDKASVEYYQNVSDDFGQKLKAGMYETNGKTYINLDNAGRCPFLDEQNLCEIYRKLGPDRMCQICREYPRYFWNLGGISYSGLHSSCPEVARFLFTHSSPLRLVPAEGASSCQIPEDFDWALFNALTNGLSIGISLLTDRTLSFSVRLRLLVLFNNALQECFDTGTDCSILLTSFSSPENYRSLADTLQAAPTNYLARISLIHHLGALDGLSQVDFLFSPVVRYLSLHSDLLSEAYGIQQLFAPFSAAPYTIQYENFAVNYLLNYYMHAYSSQDPRKVTNELIYLYCLLSCADAFIAADENALPDLEKQIEIFSKTARFFEHGKKNMSLLQKAFRDNGLTETTTLLSLI